MGRRTERRIENRAARKRFDRLLHFYDNWLWLALIVAVLSIGVAVSAHFHFQDRHLIAREATHDYIADRFGELVYPPETRLTHWLYLTSSPMWRIEYLPKSAAESFQTLARKMRSVGYAVEPAEERQFLAERPLAGDLKRIALVRQGRYGQVTAYVAEIPQHLDASEFWRRQSAYVGTYRFR